MQDSFNRQNGILVSPDQFRVFCGALSGQLRSIVDPDLSVLSIEWAERDLLDANIAFDTSVKRHEGSLFEVDLVHKRYDEIIYNVRISGVLIEEDKDSFLLTGLYIDDSPNLVGQWSELHDKLCNIAQQTSQLRSCVLR